MKKNLKLILLAGLTSGILAGCGDGRDEFVATTSQPIGSAPIAVNETITALGNATLNQAAVNGVLVNDTLNGATITSFDATTTNGGAIALNADGSFTYTPAFGFQGSDSFTYTISNDVGSDSATVTLAVNNKGVFVDNSAAAGGNGSQAQPFNNLASAIPVALSGDTIFVSRGDGTSNNLTGAVNLPNGVNLVGEGTGLVLAQTIEPQGQAPILTGPINPAGNNVIKGLRIEPGASNALQGTGIGNITFTNNMVTGGSATLISLSDLSGSNNFSNNTFESGTSTSSLIVVNNTDTNGTMAFTNNTFTDGAAGDPDEAVEVALAGTSDCSITFRGNQVSSNDETAGFTDALCVEMLDTSYVDLVFSDNTLTKSGSNALTVTNLSTTGGTYTIAGNNIDTTTDDGFDLYWNGDGAKLVATIENNTIANVDSKGIDLDGYAESTASTAIFFVRNNTITNSGSNAMQLDIGDLANVCLEFVGNTVENNVRLDNSGTGSFDVERLEAAEGGPLTDVNTFNNGAILEQFGTLTSRAAGYCLSQL